MSTPWNKSKGGLDFYRNRMFASPPPYEDGLRVEIFCLEFNVDEDFSFSLVSFITK